MYYGRNRAICKSMAAQEKARIKFKVVSINTKKEKKITRFNKNGRASCLEVLGSLKEHKKANNAYPIVGFFYFREEVHHVRLHGMLAISTVK